MKSTENGQALSEFEVIAKYFSKPATNGVVGVGDDCGIFSVRPGFQLAVSTDTLIEGRHFYSDVDPKALGHKALAVNLSDLSAVGAIPKGCLLALSLPSINPRWLDDFSRGFYQLAQTSGCLLLGGDTTRSPKHIVLTVTVFGEVPIAQALLRSKAQPDDDLWVTGSLGAPFAALQVSEGHWQLEPALLKEAKQRLHWPEPPYQWAPELIGHAHAAIDISDGLIQDLNHILVASQCGAKVFCADIPQHPVLDKLSHEQKYQAILGGGDEFQLCFTAPKTSRAFILDSARKANVAVKRIGKITETPKLEVFDFSSRPFAADSTQVVGFDHFL